MTIYNISMLFLTRGNSRGHFSYIIVCEMVNLAPFPSHS